jgi:hypothetical protein
VYKVEKLLAPGYFKWSRRHQYYMANNGAGHSMHSVWQLKYLHVFLSLHFPPPGHLSCSLINPCGNWVVYRIPTTLYKMMATDSPRHRNIYQKT